MMDSKSIVFLGVVSTIVGILIVKFLKFWSHHEDKMSSIHVCCSLSEWLQIEKLFLESMKKSKAVGLDCEWVTEDDERNPVSLLQLATAEEVCFLIRLCCFPKESLPKSLVDILENERILKVGVNVVGDAQKLAYDYGLHIKGCLDLRHLVRKRQEFQEIWNRGLRVLAQKVLNVNVVKSVDISCSNWEAEILNEEQISYAAEDAIISIQIFEAFCKQKWSRIWVYSFPFKLKPELNEEIKKFIDLPYKSTSHHCENNKAHCRLPSLNKIGKVVARSRKNPNYENCMLQAPDGQSLCACDRKKIYWYLDRGLGEVIQEEDPLIVRLNFEPSGRPVLDNFYYTQVKKDGCVVCGKCENISRKTIVPPEYRRHFPPLMKKNLSHDVLLLCSECLCLSNALDCDMRNQLAQECDAPIGTGTDVKQKADIKLCKVRSAARALLKKSEIPLARKNELIKVIQEHYGTEEISDHLLKMTAEVNTHTANDNYIPHGLKVYQYVCENGGLLAFEKRWRQHFLDSMKPKFLPDMWSVDHNHDRLALQVSQRPMNFDITILGITEDQFERVRNLWSLHAT